eukprot:2937182-Rhodomonas_salina.1
MCVHIQLYQCIRSAVLTTCSRRPWTARSSPSKTHRTRSRALPPYASSLRASYAKPGTDIPTIVRGVQY